LSPTLETLFVARILSGFAAGGIIPLSFAIVGDRFAMVERQVALSQVLAAILFGGFAGGVLAGLVGSTLGWRAVLWSTAVAALLTFLITLSGLKPRPGAVRQPFTIAGMRAGYGEVFRNPKAVVCYTAVFIEGVLLYGILPYLALILEERGAGSVREAGFVIAGFGLGGVAFSLAVRQILALTGGQMNMIRVGGVVVGLALLMVGFGVSWQAKALAFTIVGIGFYMIHNSLQVQATELAPGARGAAVALHAFFFFLGHAVGPVFFGVARDAIGTEAAIAVSATGLVLLGFLTADLLQRRGGGRTGTPPPAS
jgi:predicted MFS family arabinose efflux permease